MSIRTEPFIHHILNTYISLFYCVSPKFPFKRLGKTSFSYSTAIEIHDCCLTSNSSLSATLLLLQPIPLPLSKAYLHVKAKILLVSVTILKPSHSWWFKSCCFAMFMFPSHAQSLLLKSTTWDIPAPLLRISEWSIIHAVGTSVEFCFGHLHNWMSLSVKKGMLGRQLIRKLARGLMKWGSWVVSVYCLVPPHQAN